MRARKGTGGKEGAATALRQNKDTACAKEKEQQTAFSANGSAVLTLVYFFSPPASVFFLERTLAVHQMGR